ncbi:translocation/assembly module TamB domain-containing protein, partial [Chryseobacterium sp. SIMBA_028]
EDYSSGEKNTRTDLNVGLSKKLLNDRLKVTVGSNFALEGDARQNESTTNIAGDVTVDYSLSKDGRYMLRAYRKDEYQVALQ